MNALDVVVALEDHDLVAVDARGEHCACGVIAVFLEHYAAVGLEAADAPGSHVDVGRLHLTPTQERSIRRLLVAPRRHTARQLLSAATADSRPLIAQRLADVGLGYLLTAARPAPQTAQDALIREHWARGLNDSQIAAETGIGRRRVQERRQRLGLPANAIRGGQRKAAA